MAQARGQTMAQMALSWLLKDTRVTSVLIGASRPNSWRNVQALENLRFTEDELKRIDQHVADGELNCGRRRLNVSLMPSLSPPGERVR
jgi:L-glyceraldehyde 3-phosphate reductase